MKIGIARNRFTLGLVMALSSAYVGHAGCGGDDDKKGTGNTPAAPGAPTGDTGGAELTVLFSPMYSGFDGVHEYKIPVVLQGVKNVTFSASDPSFVDIAKTADGAMITTRKSGKVTIIASAGNLKGTSELTITQFTPDEWEAGNKRYNMGKPFVFPEFDPCADPSTYEEPEISEDLSCSNCHGITGMVFGDVQHSPQQTGGYSDEQLVTIFTMGKKPDGVGQHTMLPKSFWQMFHRWKVDETQKKGVIAYLRSLPPKAQGDLDFFGEGDGEEGFDDFPTCDGGTAGPGAAPSGGDAGR